MTAKPKTIGSWFSNQLWNTSFPWLGGIAFAIAGFYFLTNAKLDDHDKKIIEIKTAIEDQKVALVETKRIDWAEREKAREVFLADSKATAQGIAELNKQTAVMSAVLVGVKDELTKIGQRLDAKK